MGRHPRYAWYSKWWYHHLQRRRPWTDALGYVNKQFQPLGAYNTLNLPQIQLVFTSFYLGIAEGALARAAAYTKANTRGWPYQPNPVTRGSDEAYIQIGYGDLQAKLWATASLIDNVIDEASGILHTSPRQEVTRNSEQSSPSALPPPKSTP